MIMPVTKVMSTPYINVYDVSNKAATCFNPQLHCQWQLLQLTNDRQQLSTSLAKQHGSTTMWFRYPVVYEGSSKYDASPTSIYYADMNDTSYTFTSFYGVNIQDDAAAPTNMTVLMGGASAMYVSTNNLYVTYPDWDQNVGQYTSIYRVSINGLQLTFEAQGSVPGNTLNQYSMDEYNGNFRIATNWYAVEPKSTTSTSLTRT